MFDAWDRDVYLLDNLISTEETLMNRRSFVITLVLQLLAPLAAYGLPASSNQYYAALDSSYGVLKVDPVTGATLGPLFASPGANDIALGPDGLLYVSNSSQAVIHAVDPANGTLVHTIGFPIHPVYAFQAKPMLMTFGPDGRLYVSVNEVPFFGSVYVVEPTAAMATEAFNTTPFAALPLGLDFGPDGDLYVSSWGGGNFPHRVDRLDGASGALVGMVASHEDNLGNVNAVVFASDGTFYVGSGGFGSGGWITRHTVDGDYLGMLPIGPTNPSGLNILPDGDLVWGNAGSTFKRYDVATQTLSDFGSGFGSAVKMIAIPEPAAGALLAIAVAIGMRARGFGPVALKQRTGGVGLLFGKN